MPKLNTCKILGSLKRNVDEQVALSPDISYGIFGMADDMDFRRSLDLLIENQTWVLLNINGIRSDLTPLTDLLMEQIP